MSDVGDNFQNWANVHAILAIVNPRPDQQNYNRILICELIQRLEICCDSVVTKKNFSNHNRITTEFESVNEWIHRIKFCCGFCC